MQWIFTKIDQDQFSPLLLSLMEHSPHLPSAMINYTIIHTIQRNTPTETRAGEPATWAGPPRVEVAHGVVSAALPARAARVRAARRPVLASSKSF